MAAYRERGDQGGENEQRWYQTWISCTLLVGFSFETVGQFSHHYKHFNL